MPREDKEREGKEKREEGREGKDSQYTFLAKGDLWR